jgi:glycerol-3-phosphate cytidylyltransferase-like family protein
VTVAAYKRTPIMTMEERIRVVAACRFVDEGISDAPPRMAVLERMAQRAGLELSARDD